MYSETPDIRFFDTKRRQDVLTSAQIRTLQEGTLHLLQEVGVHFPSPRALEIFADHGAHVDHSTQIVHIPPDLVKKALASAPRSFVLGGREERFDLILDGSASYLCTDGCGVHVVEVFAQQAQNDRSGGHVPLSLQHTSVIYKMVYSRTSILPCQIAVGVI